MNDYFANTLHPHEFNEDNMVDLLTNPPITGEPNTIYGINRLINDATAIGNHPIIDVNDPGKPIEFRKAVGSTEE
jgi:hypothetical protein